MGSIFRSETMALCHMYLQNETAFDIVAELGRLGIVSFVDLNEDKNSLQRKFNGELLRCDAIDSQLNAIFAQIERAEIDVNDQFNDDAAPPKYRELHEYEQQVRDLSSKLISLDKNTHAIRSSFVHAQENHSVMKKIDELYSGLDLSDLGTSENSHSEINSIIGLISSSRMISLERLLWRFFGRNIFMKTINLETVFDSQDGDSEEQYKTSFAIFYKGKNIETKLQKILVAYRAQVFNMSRDASVRAEEIAKLEREIKELDVVKSKSEKYLRDMLVNNAAELSKLRIQIVKFRLIFTTLNKFNFDLTRKTMICELWCPESDRSLLLRVLDRFNQNNSGLSPSVLNVIPQSHIHREIPTFYRLNKFTIGFQNIVDSYGVANYKEVNPAPYTAITFPFLFAVMFGDAGHGLIMALFGLWMVLSERKLIAQRSKNEIWLMFFNGRYIILMMGVFAIYTGLMYNDIFAKSLNVFGSSFSPRPPFTFKNGTRIYNDTNPIYPADPKEYTGTPYPFGIDPIWQLSQNKILFINSYKMKLSVIMGVTQMLFGVVLGVFNHVFFCKHENIFFEFIPQVLFVVNIFGYMNLMIFMKWFKYSAANAGDAPSILINLINMFLMKYDDSEDTPKSLRQWYPHQKSIQTALLVSALLCVPWILIPKVVYLWRRAQRKATGAYENIDNEESDVESVAAAVAEPVPSDDGHGGHGGKFDLGDTFIHQAIHTIEYCLGSISHTASYLRLWALSLAHSQLSEVLWSMVLRNGIAAHSSSVLTNGLFLFACFSAWGVLSVAVLIVMEGLSAFLHALRLHWVEFQSKFYTGAGIQFEAYSFETALREGGLI